LFCLTYYSSILKTICILNDRWNIAHEAGLTTDILQDGKLSHTGSDSRILDGMTHFGKAFPLEHTATRELQFYPSQPDTISADFLEIGPGRGDFLLDMAGEYPDKRFVAVEMGGRRFRKLSERIEKAALTNVLLIRGDARVVLPRFIAPSSISRLFVLFPDPWPKRRQAHNRLLTADFIQLLATTIRSGGELFHATDVEEYAEWVAENCRRVGGIRLGVPAIVDNAPVEEYRPSYFEQKWRAEGKSIFYLLAHKE
jgi:tRNA (guanine-N7-)-methyltransferase